MADTPRKNWLGRALDTVASTETNPLALAWRALPPNVRAAYASLPNAVAELSPGAAVRDTVQASGETANAALQGRGWDAAGGVANMLTAAAGVVPGGKLLVKGAKAANPIRAYHGSPHDFDRFDMSKIGTGEGAQAYGHGLYFAENEGVAKVYRDALGGDAISLGGRKIVPTPGSAGDVALAHLRSGPQDVDPFAHARQSLRSALSEPEITPYSREAYWGALKQLDEWQLAGASPTAGGHMYEVNIHADPAKFLDWDKPLSQQTEMLNMLSKSRSPKVQEILNDPKLTAPTRELYGRDLGPMTGEDLYKRISIAADGRVIGPGATPIIAKTGIPGIKYLDQGSRTAGDGSSNYVAFDDKLIEILRKYGLLPVAAGGAAVAANPLSTGEERAY